MISSINAPSAPPLEEFPIGDDELYEWEENKIREIDIEDKKDRYFKIPIIDKSGNGFWYAHFKGPYVTRQINNYTNQDAEYIQEGKAGDHLMCNLHLSQTGFLEDPTLEIKEEEFNMLWKNSQPRKCMPWPICLLLFNRCKRNNKS